MELFFIAANRFRQVKLALAIVSGCPTPQSDFTKTKRHFLQQNVTKIAESILKSMTV